MKYLVVLGDGMADRPIEELNGKTPLETACTPVMDMLAEKGEVGLAATIPDGVKPGSDTANLAVLGYDPEVYYSGRSPLEALSIGVPMEADDIALRANLVTLKEGETPDFADMVITDHSSGEISTEEADMLLKAVKKGFEEKAAEDADFKKITEEFSFYTGTSYRHCCIWKKGMVTDLAQPHDHLDEKIGPYLPVITATSADKSEKCAEGARLLELMMEESYKLLKDHPVNVKRKENGLNPANCLWFWGAGTKPALAPFTEKTGKKGAMISAVDLLKGIAIGAQMKVLEVEGANGQLETNYEGKAQAALDILLKDGYDFVYIHVEAPDEMGHQGSVERKIKAIEYLDGRLIKPLFEGLQDSDEPFRMLIAPDHPTPIAVRTHTSDPVPYILYDSTAKKNGGHRYSEKEAEAGGILIKPGYKLMDRLLQSDR